MDVAEFQALVTDVLGREVGLIVFGEEQDTATMKADVSLVTLGIEDPTTATFWLEAAGIALGLNDVMEAASGKIGKKETYKKNKMATYRW